MSFPAALVLFSGGSCSLVVACERSQLEAPWGPWLQHLQQVSHEHPSHPEPWGISHPKPQCLIPVPPCRKGLLFHHLFAAASGAVFAPSDVLHEHSMAMVPEGGHKALSGPGWWSLRGSVHVCASSETQQSSQGSETPGHTWIWRGRINPHCEHTPGVWVEWTLYCGVWKPLPLATEQWEFSAFFTVFWLCGESVVTI